MGFDSEIDTIHILTSTHSLISLLFDKIFVIQEEKVGLKKLDIATYQYSLIIHTLRFGKLWLYCDYEKN